MSQSPKVPEIRPGFRDPAHVFTVVLKMGTPYVDMLDELCDANDVARRKIVEILVHEAYLELQDNPDAKIEPIE